MHSRFLSLAFAISGVLASSHSSRDNSCSGDYTLCAPSGATSIDTPQIGTQEFLSLFSDIVLSSLPSSDVKREVINNRAQSSLCCNAQLSCLVASNLLIPFCYDRFTTNYYLPDASFGTVVGGAYTSSTGDSANLETGEFKLVNGSTGNIYTLNPALKPNTAALPMPSQFTGTGIGPAIAASSLGVKITLTYTTILEGSTILATTASASLASAHTATQTILVPTTITTSISNSLVVSTGSVTSFSQIVVAESSVPAETVRGSTVQAQTVVVTTTANLAASGIAGVSGSGTSLMGGSGVSSAMSQSAGSSTLGASAAATTSQTSGGEVRWRISKSGICAVTLTSLIMCLL